MNTAHHRSLLATVTTAVLLAGCGGPQSNTAPPADPDATATTVTPNAAATPAATPPATWSTPPQLPKPGTPAGRLPQAGKINQLDATAVAIATVTTMYTYDTVTDPSSHQAIVRSLAWLTPALASQNRAAPQREWRGAQWTMWNAHHAYTKVTAQNSTEFGAPPDTTTQADRSITATIRPTGRDKWRGSAEQDVVYVSLTRANAAAPWRVSRADPQ